MRGPGFSVRNRTLLAIAGSVWLAAGGNVARIGVQAYRGLPELYQTAPAAAGQLYVRR